MVFNPSRNLYGTLDLSGVLATRERNLFITPPHMQLPKKVNKHEQQITLQLNIEHPDIFKAFLLNLTDNKFDECIAMCLTKSGNKFLELAIIMNKLTFVNKYLETVEGKKVATQCLAIACQYNNMTIINQILDLSGVQVNLKGGFKTQSAMSYAIAQSNLAVCDKLLKFDELEPVLIEDALSLISGEGDCDGEITSDAIDIVYILLSSKKILVEGCDTHFIKLFHKSFISNNLLEKLYMLTSVESKNRINVCGETLLMQCINEVSLNHRVEFLLKNSDTDINICDKSHNNALMLAIINNNMAIVKQILDRCDVVLNQKNYSGENCLNLLCKSKCDARLMDRILSCDEAVDINNKFFNKDTLLTHSIGVKNTNLFNHLINDKSLTCINDVGATGFTPLMIAYNNGSMEYFYKLLNHPDLDINKKNKFSETILMMIFKTKNDLPTLMMLMERSDIDVNTCDVDGQSLLQLSMTNHVNTHLFDKLLNKTGINVNIKNNDGDNCLMNFIKQIVENPLVEYLTELDKPQSRKPRLLVDDSLSVVQPPHIPISTQFQDMHDIRGSSINVGVGVGVGGCKDTMRMKIDNIGSLLPSIDDLFLSNTYEKEYSPFNQEPLVDIKLPPKRRLAKYIVMKDVVKPTITLSSNFQHYFTSLINHMWFEVNDQDYNGSTLLHILVKNMFYNKMTDLMMMKKKKINLNVVDYVGNTALMYAVKNGDIKYYKMLLDEGADKNIVNYDDEKAGHFTKTKKDLYTYCSIAGDLKNVYLSDVGKTSTQSIKKNWF